MTSYKMSTNKMFKTKQNTVALAAGYELDDRNLGVLSPGRVNNILNVVQTGCEAHPTTYSVDTVSSFLGCKVAGA
jgi:hypothetical protein